VRSHPPSGNLEDAHSLLQGAPIAHLPLSLLQSNVPNRKLFYLEAETHKLSPSGTPKRTALLLSRHPSERHYPEGTLRTSSMNLNPFCGTYQKHLETSPITLQRSIRGNLLQEKSRKRSLETYLGEKNESLRFQLKETRGEHELRGGRFSRLRET